jgi:exopolyphosphatase/guanosine-5'-triphosphate,3'-diphosphate pyrophosphatase
VSRVAAIDCGTNTIKLLIADLDPTSGTEVELVREMRMVRLGQGVDSTGRLADQALARAFVAIDEYAELIEAHDVDAVRFCATSASRDASNAAVFVEGVQSRLGVLPEVVSGAEEAQLSYDGATRSLGEKDLPAPILVIDIGGGSTELILGDGHGQVRSARSLDIGSVRMTERYLVSDPPERGEVAAATVAIDVALDELDGSGVALREARTAVGVGGTITTVAAMVLDLPTYERDKIHHSWLPVAAVHEATEHLLAMTHDARRALPFMHPGRADVIGAGALILHRILLRTASVLEPPDGAPQPSMLVSEADILDGIAWSVA